uniref:5' nucleotidase n=1 Tax=viral metagenome TaxID=1070528 RepID=A0A6M3XKE3_9ZZZZ
MKLKGDNIFWDLDGVLRNLTYKFLGSPFTQGEVDGWERTNDKGQDVVSFVDNNLEVLTDAPECEYMEVARLFSPIHVVSAQPDSWRRHTSAWLDAHIPDARVKYLTDTHHKLYYLDAGFRVLVEDCPLYASYRDIILIDRPYNQDITVPRRVKTPEELLIELRRFIDGNKNMGRD